MVMRILSQMINLFEGIVRQRVKVIEIYGKRGRAVTMLLLLYCKIDYLISISKQRSLHIKQPSRGLLITVKVCKMHISLSCFIVFSCCSQT